MEGLVATILSASQTQQEPYITPKAIKSILSDVIVPLLKQFSPCLVYLFPLASILYLIVKCSLICKNIYLQIGARMTEGRFCRKTGKALKMYCGV